MDPFRLSFRLPPALMLSVPVGRHHPCVHGCVLTVEPDFRVSIEGPSREQTFNQARRFLRLAGRGHGPLVLTAILVTPESAPGRWHGRDTWHIAIGAEVVIAATAIAPDIGAAPRPQETTQDNVIRLPSAG